MGQDITDIIMRETQSVISKGGFNGQYITDIIIIRGTSSNIPVPEEYQKVDLDINQGRGHDFVYLYYRKGDRCDAVRDIKVFASDNKYPLPFQVGYKIIGENADSIDLNKGLEGKFIYVYYSKNPNDGGPITDISIVKSSNGQLRIPIGYTRVDQDLHEGAGGDYMYIIFKRE
ncbi:hypothetical protein DFP93_1073 [Aneurinibacillus soli]|uniref:Uncharacterized protein n=1 Tax=Aneurinibacillus soli TaxID=1500254 RepID=A0A0U5B2J9_9BACL|nr:hypothetical protein [Aneurinibacillus soli]PYE61614.1 hypothetical protein DFP93_1073 [Aneurinibacillus soli]BAU28528.1 hypothetical protein CB4_02702 [Aneurinibacillus soli]